MRKDIKKRLERALMTLQEPGGSTIRSIIKVINKESPILSLRKVLEALQEGINEGFLCMYNGRFKLKQQLTSGKNYRNKCAYDGDGNLAEEKESEDVLKSSDMELGNEDSEFSSEDGDSIDIEKDGLTNLKRSRSQSFEKPVKKAMKQGRFYSANKSQGRDVSPTPNTSRYLSSKSGRKRNKLEYDGCENEELGRHEEKWSPGDMESIADDDDEDCDSMMDGDADADDECGEEKVPGKTAEKLEGKKPRGPRCTSMKKDVRMPSKVNIPFVPPTIPQRSRTFNELLRRSPEPLNGPPYDSYNDFSFKPDKLEYFGAYC